MAALFLVAGVAGLLNYGSGNDPLTVVLPGWLTTLFQVIFTVAGLSTLVGLGRGSFGLEGMGLVLMVTSVLMRLLLFVVYLGFPPEIIVGATFYFVLGWACLARLRSLRRGEALVRLRRDAGH
jgi:hypothetical protein